MRLSIPVLHAMTFTRQKMHRCVALCMGCICSLSPSFPTKELVVAATGAGAGRGAGRCSSQQCSFISHSAPPVHGEISCRIHFLMARQFRSRACFWETVLSLTTPTRSSRRTSLPDKGCSTWSSTFQHNAVPCVAPVPQLCSCDKAKSSSFGC